MSGQGIDQNSTQPSDSRYFPRWEVDGRTTFTLNEHGKQYEGRTKDISCAGACIISDEYVTPLQKVKVNVELSEGITVTMKGQILWVRNNENERRHMGIIFHDTPDDVQELILKYAFELDQKKVVKNWFKGWSDS